jgi:hypothetical protein
MSYRIRCRCEFLCSDDMLGFVRLYSVFHVFFGKINPKPRLIPGNLANRRAAITVDDDKHMKKETGKLLALAVAVYRTVEDSRYIQKRL